MLSENMTQADAAETVFTTLTCKKVTQGSRGYDFDLFDQL